VQEFDSQEGKWIWYHWQLVILDVHELAESIDLELSAHPHTRQILDLTLAVLSQTLKHLEKSLLMQINQTAWNSSVMKACWYQFAISNPWNQEFSGFH
jgi:hypothetical protein